MFVMCQTECVSIALYSVSFYFFNNVEPVIWIPLWLFKDAPNFEKFRTSLFLPVALSYTAENMKY